MNQYIYMSKLLSQGGFGCVFYPGFDAKDPAQLDDTMVVKLQRKSPASNNEIAISKLVMKISNYQYYYAPIVSTSAIQIGNIDDELVRSCNIISKNTSEKYMLMTIPYVNNENYFESLTNDSESDNRYIIIQLLDSYTFLLQSINFLVQQGILHYDFKDDNVVYNRIYKNPIIIDFGISIYMGDLNESEWKAVFYVYAPDYYIWCLDIQFICYLLHEKDILTKDDVEHICREYLDKHPLFLVFSQEFKKNYYEGAIQYFNQFIGVKKEKVIQTLIPFWKTWDNYSLSILNLRFLNYIFKGNGYIENSLIENLAKLLLMNIHFNPSMRHSVPETIQFYKKIYYYGQSHEEYIDLLQHIKIHGKTIQKKIKKDKLFRTDTTN